MGRLYNRNVLLGVTGGIAAYKSAQLVRDLQEAGATVRVVMTHGATEFITPLTLQALSGPPGAPELLDADAEAGMGHIELARWADLVLVAPGHRRFHQPTCPGPRRRPADHPVPGHSGAAAGRPGHEPGHVARPGHRLPISKLSPARGIHITGPGGGLPGLRRCRPRPHAGARRHRRGGPGAV